MGHRSRKLRVVALATVALAGLGSAPPPAPGTPSATAGVVRDGDVGPCGRGMLLLRPAVGQPLCTHGDDGQLAPAAREGRGDRADGPVPARAVGCYGDGLDGARVEVLTIRPRGVAGPEPAAVRRWVAQVEWTVSASAAQWDARRHVRWVTEAAPDGGCRARLRDVVLAAADVRDFSRMVAALRARGHDDPDRKYLAFVADDTYCGLASAPRDDRRTPDNAAEVRPGYARVDRPCWTGGDRGYYAVAAHELLHVLGAVQDSAPHAHGTAHCDDEWDALCYADDGGTVQVRCADRRGPTSGAGDHFNRLLDCNGDDYFRPDPPAGSYLATHWNVADSRFLSPRASDGPGYADPSGSMGTVPPDDGDRPAPGRTDEDVQEGGQRGAVALTACTVPVTGATIGPVSGRHAVARRCGTTVTAGGAPAAAVTVADAPASATVVGAPAPVTASGVGPQGPSSPVTLLVEDRVEGPLSDAPALGGRGGGARAGGAAVEEATLQTLAGVLLGVVLGTHLTVGVAVRRLPAGRRRRRSV